MTRSTRHAPFLAALALLAFAGRAHALCVDGTVTSCTINGHPGTRECVSGHWSPCEPSEPQGPPPVFAPQITGRTSTSVSVKWNGIPASGEAYALQYAVGPTLATWNPLVSIGSGSTYVHSGLQKDTRYCYRVVGTGSYGTRISTPQCRYTTDGTGRKVWRVQMEFHTGNVGDAGSDDSVSVALGELASATSLTWVDYGRDDFERNDTFTYDLNLGGIELFSDITKIRIAKTGTDGWCLQDFRLLVNERTVYTESFPGGCHWIDGDDGHQPAYEVDYTALRSHPSWQGYTEPARISLDLSAYPQVAATLRVPRAETESRVESMIGHLIHGTEAHWGDQYGRAYVEADRSAYAHRVAMDLDLEASVDYWFDPELDIDFDLHYEAKCSPDQTQAIVEIKTEALHAAVDFDWFAEFLSFILPCGAIATPIEDQPIPDCIAALEDYIGRRIENGFTPIVQSQRQALPAGFRCLSANVAVDQNANVDLTFQLQAPNPNPTPSPSPSPNPTPSPSPSPRPRPSPPPDDPPGPRCMINCP